MKWSDIFENLVSRHIVNIRHPSYPSLPHADYRLSFLLDTMQTYIPALIARPSFSDKHQTRSGQAAL
jgi:hypothetical protein